MKTGLWKLAGPLRGDIFRSCKQFFLSRGYTRSRSSSQILFSSEFVPSALGIRLAGAVWSRLWKIRAFLIIGRFTTRQTVLSSEIEGMKQGTERIRKKKKNPKNQKNLKRWGEQGKESNESCVSYISSRGTDVLCQCLICMAISKEKINRRLHSCPLVFCGRPGSGIALGTGSWVLGAPAGVMKLRCHLFQAPLLSCDTARLPSEGTRILFSSCKRLMKCRRASGTLSSEHTGFLSRTWFDRVSSTFSRVSVALCQNTI